MLQTAEDKHARTAFTHRWRPSGRHHGSRGRWWHNPQGRKGGRTCLLLVRPLLCEIKLYTYYVYFEPNLKVVLSNPRTFRKDFCFPLKIFVCLQGLSDLIWRLSRAARPQRPSLHLPPKPAARSTGCCAFFPAVRRLQARLFTCFRGEPNARA